MATPFNLTARLNVTGPYGVKPVVDSIRKSLKGIDAPVNVVIPKGINAQLKGVGKDLAFIDAQLKAITKSGASAASALSNISNALGKATSPTTSKNLAQSNAVLAKTAKGAAQAAAEIEEFGRVSGLAVRRFAGFTIATGAIFGLIDAIKSAIGEAIDFQKSMVTLAQVTGNTVQGVGALEKEVSRLSISLGVSSSELLGVAKTLAQAGLTANQTKKALDAIAKSSLAPSFDSMAETTEGLIAAMRQFRLETTQAESVLGSINSVAAQFAVEAEDIVSAIRRTGGVFAAAANPKNAQEAEGALREFVALFTSVRATTRESAESIATGLRTIFSRIQRRDTIDALKAFNVELERGGKFVGPFEAIRSLNRELSKLDPQDIRFSKILEELGGFRQVGKVIPLILQFNTALDALKVAEEGQGSLAEDAAVAQQSLANQLVKTREKFLELVREFANTESFQNTAKSILFLTDSLIELSKSFKPILPSLIALGAIKSISIAGGFFRGFRRGASGSGGAAENIGATIGSGGSTAAVLTASKGASTASLALASALAANTAAVNQLTAAIKGGSFTRGGKKFASGGLVGRRMKLMSGTQSKLTAAPKELKGFADFTRVLEKEEVARVLKQYGIGMFGKNPSVPIRSNSSGSAKLAYDDLKARAEAASNPTTSTAQAQTGDRRKRPIPVIANPNGSPMVAGFYLRGTISDGEGETGSKKVISRLREANVIPKYVNKVKIPISHNLPNPEKSSKASAAIETNLETGIAQVVTALGGQSNSALIKQATSNNGIDLSDAAGKMFEAGLAVGTGIVAKGITNEKGVSRPMDFPIPGQVATLMSFFGSGKTTAQYGDAKLTAGQDANKGIRAQFADFIAKDIDPGIQKRMRGIVKSQLASYEQQRASLRDKKASGGMVDVALTPGELVFGPSATASIGETTLRNFNNTGVLNRNTGGDVYQVPGTGNSDSFYTQLPEGSFVIKKSSAQGYANGGRVYLAGGSRSALSKRQKQELLAKQARTGAFGDDARTIASADVFGAPTLKRAIRSGITDRQVDLTSELDDLLKTLRERNASDKAVTKANEIYLRNIVRSGGATTTTSLAAKKAALGAADVVDRATAKEVEAAGVNPFKKQSRFARSFAGSREKFDQLASSPAAAAALFLGPALINSVGSKALGTSPNAQGTIGGLSGALGGAVVGAQFGPLGALAGGAVGGVGGFIDAKKEASFALANTKITDSVEKLDQAFRKLSENVTNVNLKAFNDAINEAVQSTDQLNQAFRDEDTGNITSIFASVGRGILAPIEKIAGKQFADSVAQQQQRLGAAGSQIGVSGVALSGFKGIFSALIGSGGNVNQEIEDAVKARRANQVKELIATRSPIAQQRLQFLESSVASRAEFQAPLPGFDPKEFAKKIVQGLDEGSLRALSTVDPVAFKSRSDEILDLRNQSDLAKQSGDLQRSLSLTKQAIAIEVELGQKVATNSAERIAAEKLITAAFQQSLKAINLTAEAVHRLGQAAEVANEQLDMSFSGFENLASISSNGLPSSRARGSINPFTNIEVRSQAEVDAGIRDILKALPNNRTAATAATQVREGKIIADNIQSVFKDALAQSQAAGLEVSTEEILSKSLSDPRLTGVSAENKAQIEKLFGDIASKRQGDNGLTAESLRELIIQQVNAAADTFSNLTKESIETFKTLFDTISSGNQKIGDGFNQIAATLQQRNTRLDQAFQLTQERTNDVIRMRGGEISPTSVRGNVDTFVQRLTNRAGIGATTDPTVISGSIVALQNQIKKDTEARDKVQHTDIRLYNTLSNNIANNSIRLADAKQALDTLATSTEELGAIQNKLVEFEQRKNAGRGLLEKVAAARFDPRAAVNLQKEIQDAFRLMAGGGAGVEGGAAILDQIASVIGGPAQDAVQAAIDRARLGALGPGGDLFKGLLAGVDIGAPKGKGKVESDLIDKFVKASDRQTAAMIEQAKIMNNTALQQSIELNNILTRFIDTIDRLELKSKGKRSGGWIGGLFKGNRDTELTHLVPGEFVVRRAVAQQFGPQLEAMNAGVPVEAAFARGGRVRGRNLRRRQPVERAQRVSREDRLEMRRQRRDDIFLRRGGTQLQNVQAAEALNMGGLTPLAALHGQVKGIRGNSPSLRALKSAAREASALNFNRFRREAFFGKMDFDSLEDRADVARLQQKIATASKNLRLPGFQDGGIVAATVPGEFVVNRNIARQNSGFLSALNNNRSVPKFANGGSVGSGPSMDFGQFSSAVSILVPALGNFAQFATQLAQAAHSLQNINIPTRITLEMAPVQVNVVLNGAEVLANMQEPIKSLVVGEISKAMKNHINPFTGETKDSLMKG